MSRGQQEPTIHGRAWIAPTGSRTKFGHENNISANSKVRCEVHLTALSAADGQPVDPTLTKVEADLPNWLLRIFYSAGNTDDIADKLPPRIEVKVAIGQQSRRCVAIDVERAIADLQPYREVGVDDWKHEGSALAPVRNVLAAPKMGFKALKGLKGGFKELVDDIKGIGGSGDGKPPKPSWTPAQVEDMRRQATIAALRFQTRPQEYAQARNVALQSLPAHAQQALHGQIHRADFDAMLMRDLVSGAITQQEADEFNRQSLPE